MITQNNLLFVWIREADDLTDEHGQLNTKHVATVSGCRGEELNGREHLQSHTVVLDSRENLHRYRHNSTAGGEHIYFDLLQLETWPLHFSQ